MKKLEQMDDAQLSTVEEIIDIFENPTVENCGMVGIVHGVTGPVSMDLSMTSYDSSYDYTNVTVNLTEVDPEV